jgi:hypothetical protein
MMSALVCPRHTLEQLSVVLVTMRLQIEVRRDFGKAFVANILDVCLHEIIESLQLIPHASTASAPFVIVAEDFRLHLWAQ